jgi:aminoglycoside 3-N-acetyltransferase
MNLCGTDAPFDVARTPTHKVGALSEHVRKLVQAKRSFHPFVSYAAVGPNAAEITEKVSRHAYGPHTPEARLIEMDALFVSVGLHPRESISTVHQVEHVTGVPYRYTKEFMHPVVRGEEISLEPFYLYVWYRDIDLKRDENQKLFNRIGNSVDLRGVKLGNGSMYSLSMSKFYSSAMKEFAEDIYIWCAKPPQIRPYRK